MTSRSNSPSPPVLSEHSFPAPSALRYEMRLYGLNHSVTSDNLINFFSSHTRVLGVLIHSQNGPTASVNNVNLQWAQVWVDSEEGVQKCLELKSCLTPSGITLVRAPASTTLGHAGQGTSTPGTITPNGSFELKTPPSPPPVTANASSTLLPVGSNIGPTSASIVSGPGGYNSIASLCGNFNALSVRTNPDTTGTNMGFKHVDPHGPLPRNLYVMGLPLDLTQTQFKALFTPFGMVEHSTLLSQLDGMGRRRGFVLMSTHQEAIEAMRAMNGTWHNNLKMDVSWALVQREAKHFGTSGIMPNRVVHPPTMPTRKEPLEDCAVIVENLDPSYFPDSATVREVFNHFGPVSRVNILSTAPLQVLIQFDHSVSATALIAANGLNLGGRPLVAKRYARAVNAISAPNSAPILAPVASRIPFDPFGNDFAQHVSRITGKTHLESAFNPQSQNQAHFQLQTQSRSAHPLASLGPFNPFTPSHSTSATSHVLKESKKSHLNLNFDFNPEPFTPLPWTPSQDLKNASTPLQENCPSNSLKAIYTNAAQGKNQAEVNDENKRPTPNTDGRSLQPGNIISICTAVT
ncbi:hypothetical protein L204_102591 [Cryptococcus depauperatus]